MFASSGNWTCYTNTLVFWSQCLSICVKPHLFNLFCCNTILEELPEWSSLGKNSVGPESYSWLWGALVREIVSFWWTDWPSLRHIHKHQNPITDTKLFEIIYFRVIDTAASQLIKTAITVTAIFIVALGFDSWYYLVAFNHYEFKSTIQIIGQYYTSFGSNWYYVSFLIIY